MIKNYYSVYLYLSLSIMAFYITESTPDYKLGTFAAPEEGEAVTTESGEYDEGATVEITAFTNEAKQ